MLKVTPILDRVILKQDEAPKNNGFLAIPEKSQEKPRQGTVVAVGPGAKGFDGKYMTPVVKIGDSVVYGEYAGYEITIENEKYIIIEENKILLIL